MMNAQHSCLALFALCGSLYAFFGFNCILLMLVCLLVTATSAFFCLLLYGLRERAYILTQFNVLSTIYKFEHGLPSFLRHKLRFKNLSTYCEKHFMTGFENIDSILEEILNYVMRDFVDSWYKNVSSDKLFQESLKKTIRRTTSAFSHCVKKVDWISLLTQHFVDDFASHLRLYRKAKEKLKSQKENLLKAGDLESVFFDLELEMEKSYCRDLVSTSSLYESAYLHDIVDILLYLLMPSEDFRSQPLRFLSREIIVSKILIPLLDKFSDPLYVNYLIVWLLSSVPIETDDFVTSLETCQSVQELESVLESVHEEINALRSKDNGVEGGFIDVFKKQLTSLEFTEGLIKKRMIFLINQPEVVILKQFDANGGLRSANLNSLQFVHLPITLVLTHQIAISYFIDFLTQVGGQNYIDFYLSVQGFKVSVEHQLRGLANGETAYLEVNETVKEAALFMYRQYLSQEAITRVPLEDSIINKFLARLHNDEPFDSWFEQLQEKVVDILERDDRFYPSFKKHSIYLRMLEDLDILKDVDIGDEIDFDNEKCCTLDLKTIKRFENEFESQSSINKLPLLNSVFDSDDRQDGSINYNCLLGGSPETTSQTHEKLEKKSSTSSVCDLLTSNDVDVDEDFNRCSLGSMLSSFKFLSIKRKKAKRASIILEEAFLAKTSKATTTVVIETLGLGQQNKQMFALYNVRVSITDEIGQISSAWNVIRRYSDFYTLNATISRKFLNLQNMSFPGKKTFNNLYQSFLEKRCKALNEYMACLLQTSVLESNPALKNEIFNFLSKKKYGNGNTESKISKNVYSAMFDPIISGVRAFSTVVTAMPDQVFDGIGKVGSEINKAANQVLKASSSTGSSLKITGNDNFNNINNSQSGENSSNRVAAHLTEKETNNESIPLRVLLLFVDEVFGLRGRNQWFRRRLVAFLRQFVNAALGSSINRRIIDAVQWLTSSDQVAQYLIAFKDSTWCETTIEKLNPTSEALRTCFLARCLMLSALPDELRLFIGTSTTINGVNNISEAFQNRQLNRRFWFVILERLLSVIFPNNKFGKILSILHLKSPRTLLH